MNLVKELELINADLTHREDKLQRLNDFQYKGYIKETSDPNEVFLRTEITKKQLNVANHKKKFKQLAEYRDKMHKRDKAVHKQINKDKDLNAELRARV